MPRKIDRRRSIVHGSVRDFSIWIAVALFIATGVYYYHKPIPQDHFDGTYKSGCCSIVRIHKGRFTADGQTSEIRISYLKYGYVGTLDQPVGQFFHINSGKKVPSDLLFHNNGTFTTSNYQWKHLVFTKSAQTGMRAG